MSFETKTVEAKKHTKPKSEKADVAKSAEAFATPPQQKTTDAEASKKPKPAEVLARDTTKSEAQPEKSNPKAKTEGSGSSKKTDNGRASDREGELVIDPSAWEGDPLAAWKGPVGGKPRPDNTLSNPNHTSGYAIPYSLDVNGRFEKDNASVPHTDLLYTEGNNWPDAKGGAVPGSNILPIRNETGGGVVFAGSMTPGYEQPGAAMTAVKDGSNDQYVPTPPYGWTDSVGLHTHSFPQVWVSKKDIDPGTLEGWHQSNARPDDDPNKEDHGTPGFAYGVMVRDNGRLSPSFSMSTSEGYDPEITNDPGYGMALYAYSGGQKYLVAAVSIQDIEGDSATGIAYGNKDFGVTAYPNHQGGVTVGGDLRDTINYVDEDGNLVILKDVSYELVLEKKEKTDAAIAKQEAKDPDEVKRAKHIAVEGV